MKDHSGKEQRKLNLKSIVRVYKVFGRHYKRYWKILFIAYLFLLATIGISALTPWPLKLILDQVILGEPLPEEYPFLNQLFQYEKSQLLLWLSIAIVVLALLKAIVSYINKFFVSSCGDKMEADIRERVFAHLQRLSLSFHETSRSGNTIFLLTSDVGKMMTFMVDLPQDFIHRSVTLVTFTTLMWILDWRLCLIGLAVLPVMIVSMQYFGRKMWVSMVEGRRMAGEVASIVAENAQSMAVVQAYGRQKIEMERFNKKSRRNLKFQIRVLKFSRGFSRLNDLFTISSLTAILYFGGSYAVGGEMSPGVLLLVIAYLSEIHGATGEFRKLFQGVLTAQVSAERLLELVENDMIIADDKDARPAPAFKGKVEFKDVCFAYKQGQLVLKNVNFTVEPGETVALVGPSGAGKSTIISLLLRFYDPQNGQIMIDGKDIRKYLIKSLRDQITVVLQNAKLFQQTVYDNIAFGKPAAPEKEVFQAAKLAEAHDFIMNMRNGYKTIMYEGGENLSGGQKQRINIARAIIRNTPIVILDEPLSSVDIVTETKLRSALEHLSSNKTTFIIAHKMGTIIHADKILFIHDGKLAAMGTHEELLQDCKAYRELHDSQFKWQKALAEQEGDFNGSPGISLKLAENVESR